ncbi:MAG: glycogen synthase [Selenomonadales bacterium]|nr:glycogen synthase [Selenomonadales bacterium]MBQ5636414.1 glycogen synthase [Selenomonadales bacterium]MBQ5745845.1 glycogen synthase [Selenomonadales bacterium]
MNILHIATEAVPFAKTGGLSDVVGALPKALAASGSDDVRVALPLYASVPKLYRRKMQSVGEVVVPLGWRKQPCRIYSLKHGGVLFYFFENEFYFERDNVYGYHDDHERFAFFAKAVLTALPKLGFRAEVLHMHDWHTALVSLFLKTQFYQDPYYDKIKTVLTIHTMAFQGHFGSEVLGDVLGLDDRFLSAGELGKDGGISYLQGGIRYADAVTTVSPAYADELRAEGSDYPTDAYDKLVGIINGIDTKEFDPSKDKEIPENYDAKTIKNRARNKRKLKEELELTKGDQPLISVIMRLSREKGVEVLLAALERILAQGAQVAVLGLGDYCYQEELKALEARFKGQLAVCLRFDERLAKRIYAGTDMLLLPSLTESCGLGAMLAQRYGAVVLASAVGGYKNSVVPQGEKNANGFLFEGNNEEKMLLVIREALEMYPNKRQWNKLIRTAMAEDHSWQRSAQEYIALYRTLL